MLVAQTIKITMTPGLSRVVSPHSRRRGCDVAGNMLRVRCLRASSSRHRLLLHGLLVVEHLEALAYADCLALVAQRKAPKLWEVERTRVNSCATDGIDIMGI